MDLHFILSVVRIWQLVWLIVFTAVIGNVSANSINPSGSASAAINFSLFVAAAAWICLIYGVIAHFVEAVAVTAIQIPVEVAVVLFTFIDAVVLSAKLRVVNCGSLNPEKLPNGYIAWGSANDEKRCREIQGGAVFMWFLFLSFVASVFLVWRQGQTYGRSSFRGSTLPSMSQVGSSAA